MKKYSEVKTMNERAKKKTRFKVIKTYPTEDRIATCEYEGTMEELCIELNQYLGGKTTRYRRIMEKWLSLYEQEHAGVHFEVWNISNRAWEIYVKKKL